jgi:solute carrier family 25 (mitochondrial aspartate/glutamate transporter), member 12/13
MLQDVFIGLISGYIGAIVVYPIDVIKTRAQNHIHPFTLQCIKHIIQKEGYKIFYKGSIIQLCGIGPEKALKLYVNNFVSSTLEENNFNKVLSGSLAGMAQVIITNPVERIKIQYQMNNHHNLLQTIKMIGGFRQLYKGVGLCLMRDIPFSAIYFPTYNACKNVTNNSFLSGMIAGIPAAFLVTPADVIKTRIQTHSTNNYTNIMDCIYKTYSKEGFKAFWKGSYWRVLRSSPQFGVTLWSYETLKKTYLEP